MQRLVGAILGGIAGLGFTTMGLIETSSGIDISGGNEATGTVIAIGVVVGVAIGGMVLWRWPIVIGGLIVGLALGIWLRDNADVSPVQPPVVFLLLFGLPLMGAACGYLLDRSRDGRASYDAGAPTSDR